MTTSDRGQFDAALVRRFRQAVPKRDRAAVFDRVVREHRDAVLGRCAERLWPHAEGALAAGRDVFIVAYLAMGDPAKLAHPDRLRDWLLGITGELASGVPAGIDAVNWAAVQDSTAVDVLDGAQTRGSVARRASLRLWLEQILITLPEPRQRMYDLFVRRALDSRKAAEELSTDVAVARRLRRENRDAILRAFEITALAAAAAASDPLDGVSPRCAELRQILAEGLRDGGAHGSVRRDTVVLPADLRLIVTRHASECDDCRDWRADCMAQWAPELLPIVAGSELNEQVIEDLRTIPESARAHDETLSGFGDVRTIPEYRRSHDETMAYWLPPDETEADGEPGGGRTARLGTTHVEGRKAAIAALAAGVGLLVVLLLGFVQPGFLISSTASAPAGASAASQAPGSGSLANSGASQETGTSAQVSRRPAPSTGKGSPAAESPPPTMWSVAPSQPVLSPVSPSASPTTPPVQPSSAPAPSSVPTPAPYPSPTPSSSSAKPTPTPTSSAPATPTPTPTPTTSAPPTPTPTPSTPAPSTPAPSSPNPSSPASSPVPSTPAPSSPDPSSPAPSSPGPSSPASSPVPSTPAPSSPDPSTPAPSASDSATSLPSTPAPSTPAPSTPAPSTSPAS